MRKTLCVMGTRFRKSNQPYSLVVFVFQEVKHDRLISRCIAKRRSEHIATRSTTQLRWMFRTKRTIPRRSKSVSVAFEPVLSRLACYPALFHCASLQVKIFLRLPGKT